MNAPVLSRRRWLILALLFGSTVLNYLDRQALSILASRVQADLGMTTLDYAFVVQCFLLAYTLGYPLAGWLTDRLGTKVALSIFVAWWSLANLLTGFVQSVSQLAMARTALGLGETGNYTAAPKAVSEQFPPTERGFAVGVYTAGAMMGATIAPPLIAWLALSHGWRAAFVVTGVAGFVWLLAWLAFYRKPSVPVNVASAELPALPLRSLLRDRTLWGLAGARMLADPVWYFYLFWFPKFLGEGYGMGLVQVAQVAWVVYLAADFGSIGGGWLSGRLIRRGWTPINSRLGAMGLAAVLAPLGMLIATHPGTTPMLALAAMVTFSHLMFLVNHTALVVDRYPGRSVATAIGVMGMASGLGGMLSTQAVGRLATAHSYELMFLLMGCLHPLGWLLARWAVRQ